MKFQILFGLGILLLLASCSTQSAFIEDMEDQEETENAFLQTREFYEIRKGDKIAISVWGHPDLSVGSVYGIYNSNEVYGKWLLVDGNGEIPVPEIGQIQVNNMTIEELKSFLVKEYRQLIKNPIIDVKVLNRFVSVLGEVRSPGKFLLETDRVTLYDILSQAEGFESTADQSSVLLMRTIDSKTHRLQVDFTSKNSQKYAQIQIIEGDQIFVSPKRYKEFDRRVSTLIPFTSIVTSLAILYNTIF